MIEIPDLTLGQYSLALLLPILMGIIYKVFPAIPDRFKAWITMGFALCLAILSLYYDPPEVVTAKMWIDTIIAGILIGAQAVGLYEGARAVYKPRE